MEKYTISINAGICQKHMGVRDSSNGSDGTWFPLFDIYMLHIG
jgi:hypothetical protein